MRVPSGENSRSEMWRRLSSVSAERGVGEGAGDGAGAWENAGALIREKRTATRLSGRNMKHPPWKEQGTVTVERNMVNALAKRTRSKRQEQTRRRGERWRTCRDGKWNESMRLVVPAIVIAVAVVIPVMVVFEAAMRAIPVAAVEAATFMARRNPVRASIGRSGPIAPMPNVVSVNRIPIAVNTDVVGARADGNRVMSRRRWRPDLNYDSYLCGLMMSAKQEHCRKNNGAQQALHFYSLILRTNATSSKRRLPSEMSNPAVL